MKKSINLFIILIILLALSSCGQDRLTPVYSAVTVNELTNNQPIKFNYKIDETQIDEYGTNAGKFPVFGKIFKLIIQAMANATIGKDGMELDLPPTEIDLSSLLRADFESIERINLDNLEVSIRNPDSNDNLNFLDKVEIFAKLKKPIDGLPVDEKGFTRLMYYDRVEKALGCNGKCLNLRTENINWRKFLQENQLVVIKPQITINSVPHGSMKIAGSIAFSIKFRLGF